MGYCIKLKKNIIAFILLTCLLCSVCFNAFSSASVKEVKATSVVSLVPYILSSLGVVNVLSNGQVSSVSGSIVDQLEQMVADAMGSGIYTDSNGNYVFGNDFTQSVYEALSASSNYDCRVLSNFSMSNDDIVNADYFSPALVSSISTMRTRYETYLLQYEQYVNSNGEIVSGAVCYDFSNVVGLLSNSNNYVSFIDSSYSVSRVNYCVASCIYSSSGGYSGGDTITTNSNSRTIFIKSGNLPSGFGNAFFMGAPLFRCDSRGFSFYSNRSLVVGKEVAVVRASNEQDSGIFYNSNGIPSISQTAIENNNWQNIYNNYVQNVAENYYSENGDNPFDQELLRKWMRQYSNNIIASIQAGVDDIEGAITTSNNWLRMIYDKISEINTSGGSGSGCLWTDEDIEYVLNKVNSIDVAAGGTVDQLVEIYALLQQIRSQMRYRRVPTPDIQDWLDNLPDTDILDTMQKLDVVTSALEAVVPLCYLAASSAIFTGLAHDPEPLIQDIPFKFNSSFLNLSIDEKVTIDLSIFDNVRVVLVAFETLFFIVILMFASFKFIALLLYIFGG